MEQEAKNITLTDAPLQERKHHRSKRAPTLTHWPTFEPNTVLGSAKDGSLGAIPDCCCFAASKEIMMGFLNGWGKSQNKNNIL